jgi:hypothetical protein
MADAIDERLYDSAMILWAEPLTGFVIQMGDG